MGPHYDRNEITRLLSASDNATTSDAKGDQLEDLTRYLFEKVPGVEFADRNVLEGPRAQELDLVFWNDPVSTLFFFDALIYVECKNHVAPLGSNEVGWFVRKLQDRAATVAVLVTLSGATGKNGPPPTNAHSEIVTAMVRDRVKILLMNRPEVEALRSPDDLVALLKTKFLDLSLRKTVHLSPPP